MSGVVAVHYSDEFAAASLGRFSASQLSGNYSDLAKEFDKIDRLGFLARFSVLRMNSIITLNYLNFYFKIAHD